MLLATQSSDIRHNERDGLCWTRCWRGGAWTGFSQAGIIATAFFIPVFKAIRFLQRRRTLVIAGAMMLAEVKEIPWDDMFEVIPANDFSHPLTYLDREGLPIDLLPIRLWTAKVEPGEVSGELGRGLLWSSVHLCRCGFIIQQPLSDSEARFKLLGLNHLYRLIFRYSGNANQDFSWVGRVYPPNFHFNFYLARNLREWKFILAPHHTF